MSKKLVKNSQGFVLVFDEVTNLYKQGKLQLGIDNSIAASLANNLKIERNVSAAFHLYNWIAVGVIFYSIYLSFTVHWWYFIVGLFIASIIWRSNKKGNAENIVNTAIKDQGLYNSILALNGWIYMIDEDTYNSMSNQSLTDWIHKSD